MQGNGDKAEKRYVLLSGGVGGAKLALGLSRILPPSALTIIANTGDDFEHLGLHISPDLDTLLYTLAGEVNIDTGWGRRDETWHCMDALEKLGGETWFRLGDRDLATHLERSRRLSAGESLSEVTAALCKKMGVEIRLLPMSDQKVRTRLTTDRGVLDFQHYFVRDAAAPVITRLEYAGAGTARASDGVREALGDPQLAGLVIAPSNPYLSINPILAIPDIRKAIKETSAPRVAVSPIVAGAAIKGPTAKIMRELGHEISSRTVADHYGTLIDHLLIDAADSACANGIEHSGPAVTVCNTVMTSDKDKMDLARRVIASCEMSS